MKLTEEDSLKTWDLGKLEGEKQSKEAQGKLDDQIIDEPYKKAGGDGESFNQFSSRVLDYMRKKIQDCPPNAIIVTHNTVFGLIKLWDKEGRPKMLSEAFRKTYTGQDSDTGAHYEIKNNKGGTLYICRHGETEDNREGNFRRDDVKLTPKGEAQARALGEEFKNIHVPEIITSPLHRAVETAKTIAKYQNKG